MTHGSLFSGRGTWDIVAQELGFTNLFNCEQDEWLRKSKLARISPNAQQWTNVETCTPTDTVTVLTSSFPCQDISNAAAQRATGIHGSRSSLWKETKRIAVITQPGYLILENSDKLTRKGLEVVLSDLSEIGYDAEWDCLRGTDFGYPTRRARIFVIAYPRGDRRRGFVLRPPGTIALSRKWTPTASYLHLTSCRANGYRDIRAIQRGALVHNFGREIHAFGNSVMPVIVEHIFKCIMLDMNI